MGVLVVAVDRACSVRCLPRRAAAVTPASGAGSSSTVDVELDGAIDEGELVAYVDASGSACGIHDGDIVRDGCDELRAHLVRRGVENDGALRGGCAGRRAFLAVMALLPAVVLVLGPPSPQLIICAFIEAACCLDLMRIATHHACADRPVAGGGDEEEEAAAAPDKHGCAGVAGVCSAVVTDDVPRFALFESALLWSLLAMKYFFLTGHETNFSSIQWSSAFVGFEEFSAVRGALLVSLNTFAAPLCFGLALPLVVRALFFERILQRSGRHSACAVMSGVANILWRAGRQREGFYAMVRSAAGRPFTCRLVERARVVRAGDDILPHLQFVCHCNRAVRVWGAEAPDGVGNFCAQGCVRRVAAPAHERGVLRVIRASVKQQRAAAIVL